ncbi:heavy metal sensor histidine kinase [Metapseudomonas resinovorans]|uniref:Sensor protein n=1 Tax=Metapseudomonas resinovorans NBRC 106553 TaxID=1245471 RepID=S6AGC7_METRE|nr:heavy metal sensor histidine kinase [Pseudomonas resinovorans]BAN49332.1 two-component histidine kinase CopS [Pseudomonas resinovorans NBRC 106553]
MGRLSLTARLGLLFAACTACVSLIAGVLFNRASEAHFIELDQQLLETRMDSFRALISEVDDPSALPSRLDALQAQLRLHPDLALRLEGRDGRYWFNSAEGLRAPGRDGLHDWQQDGTDYRVYSTPLRPGEPGSPRLSLALDITHHQHFLERMQRLIWLTVGLSALATALLGAWAARSGLHPLQRMAEVAAGVSASSLTTRLADDQVPQELVPLVQAFNAMLGRLDDAFQRLSAFSTDIAHELRTPLSNLLTQTQVILSQDRALDEYRETLHSNLEELQRLAQMVGDMLFLAKAEHGLLATRREPLELAGELDSLIDYFSPLAEDRRVDMRRTGDARLNADRDMLRRALFNLLDNALRFTPEGGRIELGLDSGTHGVRLTVVNNGAEIPAELLPRLFDRFFRADPARREGREHAGLGLAISRSIVLAHGGEIRCESAGGWTRFILEFPHSGR